MKELLNKKLAAGLIAGSIALAECAPTVQATPTEIAKVSPSPLSSTGIEVSPSPSIDVTPSPSAEPSPTPEVTPTPTLDPIESVKIIHYGDISTTETTASPYYYLRISRAEIVAIEPPTAQNPNFEFAITVPSDSGNIESKCSKELLTIGFGKTVTIPSCNFQGVTIWSEIIKNTWIVGGNSGTGTSGAMANIDKFKVGSVLSEIVIDFGIGNGKIITSAKAEKNLTVFNDMIANNKKKSLPRADKIFSFDVAAVDF